MSLPRYQSYKPRGVDWLGGGAGALGDAKDIKEHPQDHKWLCWPDQRHPVEDGIPTIQATHNKRGRINFDANYHVRAE